MSAFADFDLERFWEQSDYADGDYVDAPPSPEAVRAIEQKLGYKLPAAYIELAQHQNGGTPLKTCHRTTPTSWASDHIAVTGIFSIGDAKSCSLGGECGSQFMIEEWGYPDIGVYFADCPSSGHEMLCLDYRACGRDGEPQVVYIDQESGYKITFIAPNFESFIRGLQPDEDFPFED